MSKIFCINIDIYSVCNLSIVMNYVISLHTKIFTPCDLNIFKILSISIFFKFEIKLINLMFLGAIKRVLIDKMLLRANVVLYLSFC